MNQPIEEELKEWRELKSWLMNHQWDEKDAKFNELIANAPARAIVKVILNERRLLIERIEFYKKLYEGSIN